ncbi:putative methyltransferase domain-containing protein [Trichoderma compactum]
MRVAKPSVGISAAVQQALKTKCTVNVCSSTEKYSVLGVRDILATTVVSKEQPAGQGMPVWITLSHDEADAEIPTRRLSSPGTSEQDFYVEFEEKIGESIARHICDAGVLAFCAIAESCMLPTPTDTEPSGLKAVKAYSPGQNLGGWIVVLPRTRPPPNRRCTILMADFEEAERRTRSNMCRLLRGPAGAQVQHCSSCRLLYENFDWEQGREGVLVFGPEAQNHSWDHVLLSDRTYNVDVLPALAGTLSALNESNTATFWRQSPEEALFGLLSDQGWTELHRQTLPLPVLGAETQCVELYLYEKA